eukprot:scaffold45423_cov153-Skeletonema_marinoi.AAC.2
MVRGGTVKSYYLLPRFFLYSDLKTCIYLRCLHITQRCGVGRRRKECDVAYDNCTLSDLVLVLLSSSLGAKGKGVKLIFVMFSQLSRIGTSTTPGICFLGGVDVGRACHGVGDGTLLSRGGVHVCLSGFWHRSSDSLPLLFNNSLDLYMQ